MNKRTIIVVLLVSAFFLSASWAISLGVPSRVSFSGRLTDNTGEPIETSQSVTFSLWDSQSPGSGNQLGNWSETHSVSPVKGVFSVILGSVSAIPSSIFEKDNTYANVYLQVDLGSSVNSNPLNPRQQILAVPFAFRAASADMADIAIALEDPSVVQDTDWVESGSNVYKMAGNVGIGTTSPLNALHISKNLVPTVHNDGQFVIEGASGIPEGVSIGFHTGTNYGYVQAREVGVAARNLALDPDGGNVGIGTIDPKSKLDVKGNAVIGQTYSANAIAPSSGLLVEGRVGIKTTSPSAPLHVAGAIRTTDKLEFGSVGTSYPNLRRALTGSGNWGLSIDFNAVQKGYVDRYGNAGFSGAKIGATYAGNNTPPPQNALLVEGDLGVGITSPSQKVEVAGNALVQGTDGFNAVGETGTLYLGDTNHFIQAVHGSGVKIGTFQASDGIFLQQVSSNVGMGTVNPSARLDVRTPASEKSAIYAENTGPNLMTADDDGVALETGDGRIKIRRANYTVDSYVGSLPNAEVPANRAVGAITVKNLPGGTTTIRVLNAYVTPDSIVFLSGKGIELMTDHTHYFVSRTDNGFFDIQIYTAAGTGGTPPHPQFKLFFLVLE